MTKSIQETFQNNSVLNFTQEININNKIPFLGVLIDTGNINRFTTSTLKNLPTFIPTPSISIVNPPSVIKKNHHKKHLFPDILLCTLMILVP